MAIEQKHFPGKKPTVRGQVDGNAFSILGAVQAAMEKAGESRTKIDEMLERTFSSHSYNELLAICKEYVDYKI